MHAWSVNDLPDFGLLMRRYVAKCEKHETVGEVLSTLAMKRLTEAKIRLSHMQGYLNAANRLGQAFLPLGSEQGQRLSEQLQNLHPRITRDKVTLDVVGFNCNNCGMVISHRFLCSYHICSRKQQADDLFCQEGKCILCGRRWQPGSQHPCHQLNHYVIDAIGLNSIPNPCGSAASTMAEEMHINMRMPGLKVCVFMKPPNSPQRVITTKGEIIMSMHLVLGEESPRTGLGLATVTGLIPNCHPVGSKWARESPKLSKSILALYCSAQRYEMGGLPDIGGSGNVSAMSLRALNRKGEMEAVAVPPQGVAYFAHAAHGTAATCVVASMSQGNDQLSLPHNHTYEFT